MVQVDPNAATLVYVNTPGGGGLSLDPGREVTARVLSAGGGSARISLAGQHIDVSTDANLRAGDTIRLIVSAADETGVRLAIVTPDAAGGAAAAGGRSAQLIGELARAGVPVTPQLAQAVEQIAVQLGGGSNSTRAVAQLAGRDLALSAAGASRVAAALDLAGTLGPSLASLASRSDAVAAALPSGLPSATALRTLLAPNLAPAELAVARIVQALQSASGAPAATVVTPPSSSAAVIQNYVASQVALTASLDGIAANHLQHAPGAASSLAPAATPQAGSAASGGLTQAALAAATRGQEAAARSTAAAPAPLTAAATTPSGALAAPPPSTSSVASATASAAAGAAAATPTPTSPRAAAAIADLANLATRFAPAIASGTNVIGSTAQAAGRGINAADVAQQIGASGAVAAGGTSIAGAGVSGDPAPLLQAMRGFLASPGAESDAARLLRGMSGADPRALTSALTMLSEQQSMRLAGKLLELLPAASQQLGPAAMQQLQHGVHGALEALGRSFQPSLDAAARELSTLRTTLEHVAAHDPRPTVAADAARLLAATDGQQILSRTAAGADPGYVYFQVPMPDGRGAEVMVRRDPARRQISFDEFNIAFLLTTEQVGTLMIQLDAHPAGIRADVRTDVPELEPFLRARSELLVDPLTSEARRPVIVTTGVFEQAPPASLLEPRLGLIEPGATEYYA